MPKTKRRKRTDDSMRNVIFRLVPTDHALLKMASYAEGISMDEFVAECVLPKLERYRPIQETILARRASAS